MKLNNYIINIHIVGNYCIPIKIREENAELALNKAQGILNVKDGWIHLEDDFGAKHRIKNESITHLSVHQEVA
jgi:hypothetical protein